MEPEPARVGRKRDNTRDAVILDATAEILGEVGYAGLTVDMVAARAKAGKATVYRRWPSKEELVIAAVERLKRNQVDLDRLPDTGTIRGDLLALFKPDTAEEQRRRGKVIAGLASIVSSPAFADAANSAMVDPWAEAHYTLMRRAVERGEIPATVDIKTISRVLPTMAAYRALVQRRSFDWEFLVTTVDVVILPALFNPSDAHRHPHER